MHKIVKLITNDDGQKVTEPKWCLSVMFGDSDRTFCTGECYGYGEGIAEFKEKTVDKGGITCHICKRMINEIKSVRM